MRCLSLLVAGTVAWLISCSTTWDIDRYEAPEADFASRRTYSWKPGQFSTPVERSAAEFARVDSAVQASIEQELQRKGYTKVASDADMIVSYQVAGYRKYVLSDERRVGAPSPNAVLMPSGSSQLPPTSVVPTEQTVGDGSMIVFVDDPATGRLIWRGVVTTQTRVRSPEAGARLAANMAQQIVRTIPDR